jgi:hypothetical protein
MRINRVIEESILEKFKKGYAEFPEGEIEHIDKPDFIIYSNRKIGVEVTQIYKQGLSKALEETTKKVLKEIINLLKKENAPKCYISIHLNKKFFPTKLSPKEIAEFCINDIKNTINLKRPILEVSNYGQLPDIIEFYEVIYNDSIADFYYIESLGSVGGIIDNTRLQAILDKKENSKNDFIQCDEYWLVIKSGEYSADYFPSINISIEELKSSFDKIFILKYLENEVIEIK